MAASAVEISTLSQEDFKPWILYVFPGDKNSDNAAQLAQQAASAVYVQDISKLSKLPPFVDGVPVLANKKNKQAFKGTLALQTLKDLKELEVAPAPINSGYSRAMGLTHSRTFGDGSMINFPEGGNTVPDESIQILDERVSETDVSAYMERRSQITDQAVKNAQMKSGGGVPIGGDRMPPALAASKIKAVRQLAQSTNARD